MARGLGGTLGSGSTDAIRTALTSHSSTRTYAAWVYRNGTGGNGFGRILDKTNGTATEIILYDGNIEYALSREFSGGAGNWAFTSGVGTGAWFHLCLTYDSSSTTNDPIVYINGASVTVTEIAAPNGVAVTSSDAYTWGNRQSDGGRNHDGMLAEMAVWDAILTAAEAASLGKGASPLFVRPQSLVSYVPAIRDNVDRKLAAPTLTGTAVQPHPRVFYPASGWHAPKAGAGGGGGGFQAAWARAANTVIYGAQAA